MNSAKKIMNQNKDDSPKKKDSIAAPKGTATLKNSGGDGPGTKAIVMTVICVLIILVLCVGVAIQQFKPKVIASVGETDITMEDVMYPIYQAESEGLGMDAFYQYAYSMSYWEAPYQGEDSNVASGTNNSEGLKQEILNTEIQNEILYQEALKAGYTLNDDDKSQAADNVKSALKGLSGVQKFRLSFSEKSLRERFEKIALAERYEQDQQNSLNQTVDEDAAIKDISKKEYRGYKVQFYYAPTVKSNGDGATSDMTAKEKKQLAKKLKELAKKAKTAKDFSKLQNDDNDGKDSAETKSDFTFQEEEFTQKDGWSYVSAANLKKIKKMKNGTISEPILDEEAQTYLLVKMVDNSSTESYQEACDEAISKAQEEKYSEWFDGIEQNYEIIEKDGVWDDVVIGTVTTDIVTADDLEKMNEEASSDTSSEE